jgi:hypothetical protein
MNESLSISDSIASKTCYNAARLSLDILMHTGTVRSYTGIHHESLDLD